MQFGSMLALGASSCWFESSRFDFVLIILETFIYLLFIMAGSLISISSFICVAAAVAVILLRNPVHSVLFLVLSFCSGAIILLAMGAEFLGLMVLVVYVGAIAILFVFVVMMLNINMESRGSERKSLTFVGSGVVLLTLGGLSVFLPYTGTLPSSTSTFQGFGWANLFDCLNTLETLGQTL